MAIKNFNHAGYHKPVEKGKNMKSRPSYFDKNRQELQRGGKTPKDIMRDADRIIRDICYGNVNMSTDSQYLLEPTIRVALFNRARFLYEHYWVLSTALDNLLITQPMAYNDLSVRTAQIIKPKADAYRIVYEHFYQFDRSLNINVLANLPVALGQLKNSL